MPDQRLASEKVVIEAPFSYVGSTKRIWKIAAAFNGDEPWRPWVKWLLVVPFVLLLLVMAWAFITAWYVMFGLLVVPYRLLRRGSRKRKAQELRHREALAARG